jgi:signal peptidase I
MTDDTAEPLEDQSRTKPLAAFVKERLSAEARRAYERVRWHDRLVSLWAPVTVLVLLLAVYVVVVESVTCASLWLQPLMQALAVGALMWWAGLLVARLLLRGWNDARRARDHADEVRAETERVANQHRRALTAQAWTEVADATGALNRAYSRGAADVREATAALERTFERHLARFGHGGWVDAGGGLLRAVLAVLAVRAALVEPYKIPSGSMIPTLEIGDQILVNKFIYGVRLPFTNTVPFVLVRPPRRGDVIVFNNPAHPEVDYIKRVMGTPGDRLELTEEGVTVNGAALPKAEETADYAYWDTRGLDDSWAGLLRRWTTDDWVQQSETLFRETIDGQPHYILDNPASHASMLLRTLQRTVVVPDGHVFVMGDNRNNSEDSRFGLGDGSGRPRFVPLGSIKGKATIIWLSLSRGGLGSAVFGGTGLRFDRLFKSLTLCGAEPPLAGATREMLSGGAGNPET